MTRRLSNVKAREVRKLLRSLGYEMIRKRGKGSHEQYRHLATGRWTTLSWKQNEAVPAGTLKRIAKNLGLTTQGLLDGLYPGIIASVITAPNKRGEGISARTGLNSSG